MTSRGYRDEMTRRWTIGNVIRLALPAIVIALTLLAMAAASPPWSRSVVVTAGPSIDPPSVADDPSEIADSTPVFDVLAEVRPDRSVQVTETIVQVFREARHGIERTIPLSDDTGDHPMRSLEVEASVGTPAEVELGDEGDVLRIRIGDPDVTITGAHTYRLTYVLEDVVTDLADGTQQVRLDALDGWQHSIGSIRHVVVASDSAEPLRVTCWSGPRGTTDPCGPSLDAGLAMTTQVDFPAGTFAAGPPVTHDTDVPVAIAAGVGLLLSVALAGFIAHRRAITSRRRAALTATGVDTPGPAPIEFTPPLDLDPACCLRLAETSRADVGRMASASVVDMIADGVLDARAVAGSASPDWIITRGSRGPRTPWEERLATAIMGDHEEVTLSERGRPIGRAMRAVASKVDAELRRLELLTGPRIPTSAPVPGGAWLLMVAACIVLAVVTPGLVSLGSALVDRRVALGIVGFLGAGGMVAVAATHDRRRTRSYTATGRATAWRLEGFRRFFEQSEFAHVETADRLGHVREYAGHAAAFGALDRWVESVPVDLPTGPTATTTWSDLAAIHRAAIWRTAGHTTRTSSSGRSGGSSGSFSGGGSGGGGGGSW